MDPASWLARLGLGRPELRAWALYDWANSAFVTTVVTAVFPIYFARVVSAGQPASVATAHFATASTAALAFAALLSIPAGALADRIPVKKKLLAATIAVGAAATAGLGFVGPGDVALALALFAVGNVALMVGFVFYDALLRHVASDEEVDRASAAGYALGYVGGGLLLLVNLAWIEFPDWFGLASPEAASRLSFASVAVWWVLFSIPLFLRVREPRIAPGVSASRARRPFAELVRELRAHPDALVLLVAYLLYNDGIGTVYRMAGIYGAEIGLSTGTLVLALLATQFVSIPFTFAAGRVSDRIGARTTVLAGLGAYLVVCALAYRARSATDFWMIAMLVAVIQGGTQSLSRSLFAKLVPKERATQYFALFGMSDKVSGILGPAVFALVVSQTGSSRPAILSVAATFAVGAFLLARVDVERGRAIASRPETVGARG